MPLFLRPFPSRRMSPCAPDGDSWVSLSAIASSTRACSDLRNAALTRSELLRDRERSRAYVASVAERGRRPAAAPPSLGLSRSFPPSRRCSSRSSSLSNGPSSRARLARPARSRANFSRLYRSWFRALSAPHLPLAWSRVGSSASRARARSLRQRGRRSRAAAGGSGSGGETGKVRETSARRAGRQRSIGSAKVEQATVGRTGRARFSHRARRWFRAVLERRLESRSDTGTYLVEDELIARSLASARHRGVAASWRARRPTV